jgi:hypothetical protein
MMITSAMRIAIAPANFCHNLSGWAGAIRLDLPEF